MYNFLGCLRGSTCYTWLVYRDSHRPVKHRCSFVRNSSRKRAGTYTSYTKSVCRETKFSRRGSFLDETDTRHFTTEMFFSFNHGSIHFQRKR